MRKLSSSSPAGRVALDIHDGCTRVISRHLSISYIVQSSPINEIRAVGRSRCHMRLISTRKSYPDCSTNVAIDRTDDFKK